MAELVEVLQIDGSSAVRTLKDLKDEVKNLKKELDNCVVGSDEFNQTLDELTDAQTELKNATKTSTEALEGSYDALVKKMGELKKEWRATADVAQRANLGEEISSINDQLKEMDASIGNYQRNVGNYRGSLEGMTVNIGNFNEMTRALAGSFDMVEGGLKSMGIESEQANKMLEKMKGLMVMTNGLNSVKEGVTAFNNLKTSITLAVSAQNGLNAAMSANPIGAVAAIAAVLVTGLVALVSWLDKAADSAESLKEMNEELTESFKKQNDEMNYNLELMKIRGSSTMEQYKYQLDNLVAMADEAHRVYQRMREKAKESNWLGFGGDISKEEQERIDKAFEEWNNLQKQIVLVKERIAAEEKRIEEQKAAAERKVAEERNRLAQQNKKQKEDQAKRDADAAAQTLEDIKAAHEALLKELEEYYMTEYEIKVRRARETAEEQVKVAKAAFENGLITKEQFQKTVFDIWTVFEDESTKLWEEAERAKQAAIKSTTEVVKTETKEQKNAVEEVTWATMDFKQRMTSVAGLVSTAFGQTSQLLNTLASTQDKTSKEGFEKYKKLAVGAATMSMLQGIIAAWTSAMQLPPPISFITGGIMSAATATLGGIQISEIKKQRFEGSGTSNSSSSTASSIPNVNTAALLGTPVNYTSEIADAKTEENMVDTRVYVVESDITNTTNKVKVTEEESTF